MDHLSQAQIIRSNRAAACWSYQLRSSSQKSFQYCFQTGRSWRFMWRTLEQLKLFQLSKHRGFRELGWNTGTTVIQVCTQTTPWKPWKIGRLVQWIGKYKTGQFIKSLGIYWTYVYIIWYAHHSIKTATTWFFCHLWGSVSKIIWARPEIGAMDALKIGASRNGTIVVAALAIAFGHSTRWPAPSLPNRQLLAFVDEIPWALWRNTKLNNKWLGLGILYIFGMTWKGSEGSTRISPII